MIRAKIIKRNKIKGIIRFRARVTDVYKQHPLKKNNTKKKRRRNSISATHGTSEMGSQGDMVANNRGQRKNNNNNKRGGVKTTPSKHAKFYVYVRRKDLKCSCPELKLRRTYLIVTSLGRKSDPTVTRGKIFLDRRSVVIPWRRKYKKLLVRFQARERQGKCKRFRR